MKTMYNYKTKEERRQEIDEAIKTLQEGLKEILESDKYKQYLENMSNFHNYSVNNQILIFCQRKTATMCASYQTWKSKFNRQVKKGEHGLKVIVPIKYKIKKYKENPETHEYMLDENGERIIEDTGEKGITFKLGTTFDVSQTEQIEGKEEIPLSPCKELIGNVDSYSLIINALEKNSPVSINFVGKENDIALLTGAKGYFSPKENHIVILQGMSESQTLKTMIHETSHSILHNMDRMKQYKENGIEISREDQEIQAESIAFVVSHHFGLDTSEYSFPYIATWSKDINIAIQNLNIIKEASHTLIEGMEQYLEKQLGLTMANDSPELQQETSPKKTLEEYEINEQQGEKICS